MPKKCAGFFIKMNDQEIYQKIKKITKKFDIVQSSIEFYRKEFSDLEDKLSITQNTHGFQTPEKTSRKQSAK